MIAESIHFCLRSQLTLEVFEDEMNELGNGLEAATGAAQIADASRSIVRTISKSRANYWLSYVVDFICPVLFGYLGWRRQPGWESIGIGFVFGVFVFTLVEYSIHRWLLHDPRSVLFQAHEAHHLDPDKPSAFLFPASFVVLMPIWLLLAGWLRIPGASFFLCGFSAAYFYYGLLHHFEHTTRINQIPFRWLQGRWAAHSVHHRRDNSNFGVMTSFWDYVFGTHQRQMKRKALRA
jgi:sterol desaturase/sphingolipid hydroxylase (fatty acid hydroxylase superfamily)